MPIDTPRLSLSKPEEDDLILALRPTLEGDFDTLDANALLAKGDWASGTAYVVNDVAVVAGRAHRCILAHTNQQPPNASYWEPWGGDIAAGGALAGSYPNPSIAAGAITDTSVADAAAIAQSKVANLTSALGVLTAGVAAAEVAANKGAASGYASLSSGTVPTGQLGSGTADATTFLRGDKTWALLDMAVEFGIAVSDETSVLTTGVAKVTFRLPHAMTLTAVRANVNTASTSGLPTVDINANGSTVLSTKVTIDANEKTSVTAATPAVISTSSLTDDAEITIDVDVAGTGTRGLKVWMLGTR